jgi:hypothetical protein
VEAEARSEAGIAEGDDPEERAARAKAARRD